MVPPHRLSLPKRVRYYYATRRKFLVPEVSFDLTTARLSGEYLPIRSLWQNSLRNTRRSRDISINELLFSFSSFRRQQLSNPYCTDFAYRSSSFDEDQDHSWLGTRLLILLIIVLVFVSLSSRYMSRSGNILPDTASQTAHRGFLRIVWWTSTVPPRVLVRAKHSCYLSTLQAHYSFIFYGAS